MVVDLDSLRALLDGGGPDRAYVDAMLRIGWSRSRERSRLEALHRDLRATARRAHAQIRSEIARGELRGARLRERFDSVSEPERDHYVEEVLGIAYPPLEETVLGPELLSYSPSGYEEIVHALDVTELGAEGRFLDLGSGMGKAVMLAEVLTGAVSAGVECEPVLHSISESAARELGLAASFRHVDAREIAFEGTDVVFMYLPFTGSVLSTVMTRLLRTEKRARRFLCAGAVDAHRYPELVAAAPPKSWLSVYAWR